MSLGRSEPQCLSMHPGDWGVQCQRSVGHGTYHWARVLHPDGVWTATWYDPEVIREMLHRKK